MPVMPGAVWRPITIPGGTTRRTSKGRAVVLHVAVSEAASLFGFFNNNPGANSHFYVAKDGTIEQYVDTDNESWASMTANASTISVETQGGVTNPETEPWTAAQLASLARICAWAHTVEGTPLAPMPDSRPASTGIGYHRLGINPWRVSGGELWSSSVGKICPGAAKIAQIPAIAAAAASGLQEDDMYDATARDEVVGRLDQLIGEMSGVHAFASRADVTLNDHTVGMRAQFAALQGKIAGLTTAIGQISGGSVDLAAVTAAADQGVKNALAEVAAAVAAAS